MVKEAACNAGDVGSLPGSGRSPGEGRKWHPIPVFLPGKSGGQRSLAGYSPWDHKRVRYDLATFWKRNMKGGQTLMRGVGKQPCVPNNSLIFLQQKVSLSPRGNHLKNSLLWRAGLFISEADYGPAVPSPGILEL